MARIHSIIQDRWFDDALTLLGHVSIEILFGSEACKKVFGHVLLDLSAWFHDIKSISMLTSQWWFTVWRRVFEYYSLFNIQDTTIYLIVRWSLLWRDVRITSWSKFRKSWCGNLKCGLKILEILSNFKSFTEALISSNTKNVASIWVWFLKRGYYFGIIHKT